MSCPCVKSVAALISFIDQMLPEDLCADVQDDARHKACGLRAFLMRALSLPLAGALAAPVLVSLQGALPLWQVAALLTCLVPLLSSVLMQRGQIFAARLILIGALAGLAASLSWGLGFSLAVFAVLIAACSEVALLTRARAGLWSLLGTGALILAFVAPRAGLIWPDMLLAGAGAAYLISLLMQMQSAGQSQTSELALARHHHAALENVLGDLRLQVNRAGAVTFVDPCVREKMRLTRRDLSGRGFFERLALVDRPALIKALGNAVQSGATQILRVQFHLRDEESPRACFITPIYVPLDLRLQAIGADEILVLARLVETTQENDAHEQAWKERLIAHVSHELRTPLNAIIGFSNLLTHSAAQDEAQRQDYAQIIQTSSQHLLDLVNALLDMSQMQTGNFPVAPESFAFDTLVDECCDMMKLKADEAHLTLCRQVQRDATIMMADRRACKQILINLLSNAIKFTPAGGTITVHAQQSGSDLLLAVRDTGVGIAAEDLPHLGDPFFQVQTQEPRTQEGAGLGLSLVKGLVGLQGGTLVIESALAQGTCVTIRLPMDCRPLIAGHAKPAIIHSVAAPVAAASLPDMMMVKKIA